ncbi:MAG: hypothetical protein IPL06_22975 [Betaproteobacteria bacterium]|nr:hypothetical protein [Betaproteobacteria bacterium]HQZ46807.1 hypothetical protein [Usitatibacteraceae bacterium]
MRPAPCLFFFCAFAALSVAAQESKPWLESQGLEAASWKSFQEFEAVVARIPNAKDPPGPQERLIVFRQGKPVLQVTDKDGIEAASRLTLHSLGRDLDGDGQPDLHFSAYSGGAHCCTTHFVYKVKPAVKRLAVYAAKNLGGTDFVDLPGRKTPVMVSADDTSAYVFAPYASSYFPVAVLEVSPKGRFQFAGDLMRGKLPGEPPPVCAQPAATANPWLKDRCGEFTSAKRKARTQEIQAKLREIKSQRSADKLKWDDYFATGVLSAVAAEMNRYAYTGFGAAGMNWLETVWPGNDAIKVQFLAKLRETRVKSAFADDLRVLSTDTR